MMGEAAGAVTDGMEGLIATASIYPPGQLIKGIVVNNRGERFVAEDSYHGRTAAYAMEQPDQEAFLIVNSEVFAYPEIASARHELIDGWDSIEAMEQGLNLPEGSLQDTMARYNQDAAAGEDTFLHKQSDWLKPLDKVPGRRSIFPSDSRAICISRWGAYVPTAMRRRWIMTDMWCRGSTRQVPAVLIYPETAKAMPAA